MSNLYKVSGATIVRPSQTRTIRLVGYNNPEVVLPELLKEYFADVGYMEMYPNFKTLRISAVHPFAILLLQETTGVKSDVNLFPSITIADTSDAETYDTLGRESSNIMFGAEEVARLKWEYLRGNILTSSGNITRMENATNGGNKINGIMTSYRANHNVDLNIWADNKDMVSLIFDLLKHFIISNITKLHAMGIDVEGAINGRRSGDINLDFGKLLYGANITVPMIIRTTNMSIDLEVEEVTDIASETDPDSIGMSGEYHVLGVD